MVAGGGAAKPSGSPGNLVVLDWAGFKGGPSYCFDDAQPSHVEHYAELEAAGVPLTFYLNVGGGARGDDATWTRLAPRGHKLGNHTVHHCHRDLTGCGGTPLASKEAEIDECSSYIREHYGQIAWTMAWTSRSAQSRHSSDAWCERRYSKVLSAIALSVSVSEMRAARDHYQRRAQRDCENENTANARLVCVKHFLSILVDEVRKSKRHVDERRA